jgi:hypothetical protein
MESEFQRQPRQTTLSFNYRINQNQKQRPDRGGDNGGGDGGDFGDF